MDDDDVRVDELVRLARSDPTRLGRLLDYYRPYLTLVAQSRIGARLRRRCDPEDVVQDTMADAHRGFRSFQGFTEAEFSAWIKRIHCNNLRDIVRKHVLAANQSLEIEQSLDDDDGDASLRWNQPAADDSSASQRVIRGEDALRLAQRMQKLPDTQREALRLRYFEGMAVEEIARQMDKTVSAAANLIKHGLQGLRKRMHYDTWF
jgi:RNA polymerase sigma-70 factor (ECF subfamily)